MDEAARKNFHNEVFSTPVAASAARGRGRVFITGNGNRNRPKAPLVAALKRQGYATYRYRVLEKYDGLRRWCRSEGRGTAITSVYPSYAVSGRDHQGRPLALGRGTAITHVDAAYTVSRWDHPGRWLALGSMTGGAWDRVCRLARRASEIASEIVGVDEDGGADPKDGVEPEVE